MTSRRKRGRKTFSDRLPAGTGKRFREELLTCLQGDDFKVEYLRTEVFSKYLDPKVVSPSQRRTNAIEKWLGCEQRNMSTNGRLYFLDGDLGWITIDKLLSDVKSLVSDILGVRDEERLDMCDFVTRGILQLVPHTNGASTRVKRGPAAAVHKLAGTAHATRDALPYWSYLVDDTVLKNQEVCIVDGSVMFTVDKSTDIDRVACKEPEINMALQRSVGNYIRRCLRRRGVNLNDQTHNQRLAQHALDQGLATVDLSSASDSITTSLAFLCLPRSIWSLCDDLRVKQTRLPSPYDRDHHLEMFSSMGNGFTFELESLLFYAITRVVARRSGIKGRISVYGDDIICHSHLVPRLSRVFYYLGFRMNQKKTHFKGHFRESCGKHYYRGLDVSPFYIRREVSTVSDLILHLNHLLEWETRYATGLNFEFFTDGAIREFHRKWSKVVPPFLHGGYDVTSNTSLVTGDKPRKRIHLITSTIEIPEDAALHHWYMVADHNGPLREPFDVHPEVEVLRTVRYNPPKPFWLEQCAWHPYLLLE